MSETDHTAASTTIGDSDLEQLRDQLERAVEIPFYRERYDEAGVDVSAVTSVDDFAELPFITTEDLSEDFASSPPYGSFQAEGAQHMFLTPAGEQLMPQFNTDADWTRMAEVHADHYRDLGIGEGDIVLNCLGYSLFIAGLVQHEAILEAGATPVPVGPGDSEQAASLAERFDADAMIAFPSFAQKVVERADTSLDLLIGVGEPLSVSAERREEVRASFDAETTVVDLYGIAQAGLAAVECAGENGMHVMEDLVIAEIIDPETGDLLEYGERGELVLTHLNKEAMPLVRYRTGDLTSLDRIGCDCGRRHTLPSGVIGRVDSRLKVKGVKVYPDVIPPVLDATPGVGESFKLEIDREDRTDHVTLIAESDDPAAVDRDALAEALASELLIRPNEIEFQSTIDDEETVVDHRYE
jgi:phenylacetate-CoA ligase